MKVDHIFANTLDKTKGPANCIPTLCDALSKHGNEIRLHTLGENSDNIKDDYHLLIHPKSRYLKMLGRSRSLYRSLKESVQFLDILHSHSLWTLPTLYPAWAVRNTSCLHVISPRGTLSEWTLAKSRWKKKAMWWLASRQALQTSACLHATAESEYIDIRNQGLTAPVAVIPNVVTIPSSKRYRASASVYKKLLFLSRIHPKKGVDILLRAWKNVQSRFPYWRLEIVGPDNDGYLYNMKELARILEVERVTFTGGLIGEKKANAFETADLFVLPTHSENFGIAVAEALSYSVPAIVSKGAPWEGLNSKKCGWWIDVGVEPLTECLLNVLNLPMDELCGFGERGRMWIEQDFSIDRIGRMMHETYRWLIEGGGLPSWVKIE
jgi:glycosyltransferase involved in cell wall biosynthesis